MRFMRLAPTVTEQCYFMRKYAKVQVHTDQTEISFPVKINTIIYTQSLKVVWNMLNVSDTIRVRWHDAYTKHTLCL